jgi:signal transduction histidine kinase
MSSRSARLGDRSDLLSRSSVGIHHTIATDAIAIRAREALEATGRAQFLASASRDLAMSLDETVTRDTVRRLSLPRPGSWCIVDVVEPNGAIHRLPVVHSDPVKQRLGRTLEGQSLPRGSDASPPAALSDHSGAAVLLVTHGKNNLRILREIGFGAMLVVPLIVRARLQGAVTFISRAGDPPFTSEENTLAVDLASRCAMALDNARLFHEADSKRLLAETANLTKGRFLGWISHELRAPLNAIGGFADLIGMGIEGPVSERQRIALARIRANQEHLLVLISEILGFVGVESGRMEYHVAAVSIPHALSDVAGMLGAVITDKGLIVSGPRAEAVAIAWADRDRVRQILVNLVMNAVKYTPSSGTVSLDCEVAGDAVLVRVSDTGPGIPAEKLESIFEPFVQLKAGSKDRQGGVGLGLAISRDLARAMGGDLTAESSAGIGSRFTLTLPLARPDARKILTDYEMRA